MSHLAERDTVTNALPPGPQRGVAELSDWFNQDPFGRLEELAREYGPIFTLRLGSFGSQRDTGIAHNGNWVFLTRPHQVKIMHEASQDTVDAAAANKVFFGVDDDGSVGYIAGRSHRRRRSQLLPAFSARRDYAAVVAEVTRAFIAEWASRGRFELFGELQQMTSEVILRIVCGNLAPADRRRLRRLLPMTEDARLSLADVDDAVAEIRQIVGRSLPGYLAEAEASGDHDVLASLLQRAREGDESLSPEVVIDEVFSLLYTGFSTTSNSLSWAFARLLTEPRARRRLQEEVADRFSGGPLSQEDFADLRYVEATVKETLRLHPVAALNGVRMVTRPLRIDQYLFPPGTFLVQCAHLLQRSPDLYPEPEQFRPERFLDRPADPGAWAPFGGGDRICIGRGFASEEMKMVLAIVFSTVSLELVGEFPSAERQGLFMAPRNRVPVTVSGPAGS